VRNFSVHADDPGVAESLTGGLIAVCAVSWFRGGIVSYASQVKFDLLASGRPRRSGSRRTDGARRAQVAQRDSDSA